MEHEKKFLIIGNMNCVTYKEIFPLIRDNKMWVGANEKGGTRKGNSLCFTVPDSFTGKTIDVDGIPMAQVSAWWFTNLDFAKRHQQYIFWKQYNSEEYPTYDNYDAIECSHSDSIPIDWDGVIGVPISFLNGFYNPEQFEILGATQRGCHDAVPDIKKYDDYKEINYKTGKPTGSSGGKTNENTNLKMNDGKKNYFINASGDIIQSTFQRIFIRRKKVS